ncbi:MAG TPA: alpha-L-fucosidase, partial [Thermoguttaceae bacterium]|nr:alpha-L-fucosidase [Thermoguttaceae bacterium]
MKPTSPIAACLLLVIATTAWADELQPNGPQPNGPQSTDPPGRIRYEPTWESLDSRPVPTWFNEAKFGIFIVWGPYSVPGWAPPNAYAEWYGHRAWKRQKGYWDFYTQHYGDSFDYKQFGEKFTAERWDPDDWAQLFADAGARYVSFAVKYHDGYCLWGDTQTRAMKGRRYEMPPGYSEVADLYADGWNSVDTGPHRDLTADMAAALEKVGVRWGVYYSLYEWWHPLWVSNRERYVREHYFPQFKEMVTKYRPEFIFTDGEWEAGEDVWRPKEMLAWLFNESPVRETIVTNDRFGAMRKKHGPV